MALLGLLQAGGSVLGQAMEQVTGGSLLSMLLISCAFTLSLVYLLRLAIGHLAPLPAGAVGALPGSWEGYLGTREAEGLAGAATALCSLLSVVGGRIGGLGVAATHLALLALVVAVFILLVAACLVLAGVVLAAFVVTVILLAAEPVVLMVWR